MNIEEYLLLFKIKISKEAYLDFEKKRMSNNSCISGIQWANLINEQNFSCFYCNTNIETIQELIYTGLINPRKRGVHGYSGFHFELDHKNANKIDNDVNNLVASCYFCNNDKSNTFSSEIFKNYFGKFKGKSFQELFDASKLKHLGTYRHQYSK